MVDVGTLVKGPETKTRQGGNVPELNKLAEWCAAKEWTLTDAAGLTGYSPSYLSLIANGKRPLSPAAKVKIARRLGARVAEIFPISAEATSEASDDVAVTAQ